MMKSSLKQAESLYHSSISTPSFNRLDIPRCHKTHNYMRISFLFSPFLLITRLRMQQKKKNRSYISFYRVSASRTVYEQILLYEYIIHDWGGKNKFNLTKKASSNDETFLFQHDTNSFVSAIRHCNDRFSIFVYEVLD